MDNCNGTDYINSNTNGIIDDYTLNPSDPSFQPDLEAGTNFTTAVTSFEISNNSQEQLIDNRTDNSTLPNQNSL